MFNLIKNCFKGKRDDISHFCKITGISKNTLFMLERANLTNDQFNSFNKLCKTLGISSDELFSLKKERELRFKEVRTASKKTLKQVSEDLKIRDSTLSQYETGKRSPSIETLVQLAGYYGVTIDYLVGR